MQVYRANRSLEHARSKSWIPLPVGGSQPKTGKKRILSSRQQYTSKWKTKACDVVKLLVDRGKMVDPGDKAWW